MMNKKDYCEYDACMALKELGYNKGSEYTYIDNYRVCDEILDKHPGLSDSGYMDLIDEYGGIYKRSEVYKLYIEPVKAWSRNTMIDTDLGEHCSCVHLYDAQQWLREVKNLHITIFSSSQESWMYRITKPHQKLEEGVYGEDFTSYEEALQFAIKECVKILTTN